VAASKQFSVRFPAELANKLTKRGKAAPFIVEAVREKLDREERERIEASLLCLANDPEANDISDFAEAQRRVMARGD
jgi:hypothetical protein